MLDHKGSTYTRVFPKKEENHGGVSKVGEVHKRSTNRSLFSPTLHALTHPGFLLLLEHSRVNTNFMVRTQAALVHTEIPRNPTEP